MSSQDQIFAFYSLDNVKCSHAGPLACGSGDRCSHSVDALASSTYAAVHLYLACAKAKPHERPPRAEPMVQSVFEVVTGAKIYQVAGAKGGC